MNEQATGGASPPRISLLTSFYNAEPYLGAAIESALAQSFTDFELVLRDDGSTDDSLSTARRYAAAAPHIRLLTGENLGYGRSLRVLAESARGELLGVLEADDLLDPDALAATAEALDADPELGFVYSDYALIDEKGNSLGPGRRTEVPYSRMSLLVHFMTFQFRLLRRTCFDRAGGFDPSMIGAEDYDLCLRMSEVAGVRHVPKTLYRYRKHKESFSATRRTEQIEAAARAVRCALQRRGLDREYELEVEILSRFALRKRQQAAGDPSGAPPADQPTP